MRIDHHAYQRATAVAASGLFAQLAIALVLLIFGKVTGDSSATIASLWAFGGLVVWLGLILLFHQQRLERLESLEMDGAARLDDQGRLFTPDEARVARRRLGLMNAVLMPVFSIVYALYLVGVAWGLIWWLGRYSDPNADLGTFALGSAPGWQLAVAFGIALLSFIFSRFLAGMAVQSAWTNLRGGASVMVGNALVALAIGSGTAYAMLADEGKGLPVLEGIVYGLAIFMIVVAAETALNFVLNLYRPRRAGESPRPAFDSRILSLFAAPDSIVRSINEAVNYQFGFDITSSWGYQLLLRNFVKLVAVGVFVVLLLTTLVVVEPQEQALRLRFGARVGDVYQGAPLVKLPWPIDTAIVRDVNRVREIPLGVIRPVGPSDFVSWGEETVEVDLDTNLFLVAAGARGDLGATGSPALTLLATGENAAATQATDQFAVVEADIVLQYRVRDRELEKFLGFVNDARSRREALDMRERAMKSVAMREVTRAMSARTLDEVLSPPIDRPLVDALAQDIQKAFDALDCGVEVVGISIPRLRPPGKDGGKFEELSVARQNSRRQLEDAQSMVNTAMSLLVGGPDAGAEIFAGLQELVKLEDAAKAAGGEEAAKQAAALRARLEQRILDSRAQAASVISGARALRWTALMDAQSIAQDVLGQAAAWNVDPELYRNRRTMEALAEALAAVRVKYMLLPDADRVHLDVEMQQPTSGLNLGDYLEKKDGSSE
jgi:regulator of protease activity HflC (stomatin/prohibitin superfamily)